MNYHHHIVIVIAILIVVHVRNSLSNISSALSLNACLYTRVCVCVCLRTVYHCYCYTCICLSVMPAFVCVCALVTQFTQHILCVCERSTNIHIISLTRYFCIHRKLLYWVTHTHITHVRSLVWLKFGIIFKKRFRKSLCEGTTWATHCLTTLVLFQKKTIRIKSCNFVIWMHQRNIRSNHE